MGKCPHKDIQFCPLYVASHGLNGLDGKYIGCDDGKLGDGLCGVDRGVCYSAELARMKAAHPAEVARLAFMADAAEGKAQRDRNMRRIGIH